MKDYTLSQLKEHCDTVIASFGSRACEECVKSEIGHVCSNYFMCGIKLLPIVDKRSTTKLLYVEDGSIDVNELKQILPINIKIVPYRSGSQKPELVTLLASAETNL